MAPDPFGAYFDLIKASDHIFGLLWRFRAGLIGIGRIATRVRGANTVIVSRALPNGRVTVGCDVLTDRRDLREGTVVTGRTLNLEARLITGVIGPAQVNLGLTNGRRRQTAWCRRKYGGLIRDRRSFR